MKKLVFAFVAILTASSVLAQLGRPSAAGGSASITSGSTPISGGGNTQVCFNDSATIACGDAGLTYVKGTDTLTSGMYIAGDGSAVAPTVHGSVATTGMYFNSGTNFSYLGGLKLAVGSSVVVVGTDVSPSATANNQTVGLTGTRWAQLWLDATLTAAGTTGARTIDKNLGQVNFAAAATTLVVTDSRVTTTSFVFVTPQTSDATCKSFAVTRAAGSFTLTANAACTAETAVAFLVMPN